MKKNILKKFLVLFSLLFCFNTYLANAEVAIIEDPVVSDTNPPVITLVGDSEVRIKVGDVYQDAGAKAQDDIDGDISASVTAGGLDLIDNTKVGTYLITYNVHDNALNNAVAVTRNVIVEEVPVVIIPTDIHLGVISGNEYLYNNDISVLPCDSDNNKETPDIATPYCALEQAKVPSEWNGLWINSIALIKNDDTNFIYWMWLSNLDFANFNLSSKQYELKSGDQILFYFNTTPLNISVDNKNPEVGGIVAVKVGQLGFDASWNPVWVPATSGKVIIGSESFDLDENGEFKINISNENPIIIRGQKEGFIDTPLLTITPNKPTENTGGGSSGGGSSVDTKKEFSLDKAFDFLSSKQNSDGSFANSMYTDWAAIALSLKNNSAKNKIIQYLKTNNIDGNTLTDYERRAMALMSLGVNPYNGTEINYIKNIIESFDGTQFGDPSLINDDIFAIIVLKNAGYNENDEIIKKDTEYIISQQSGGSWGSIDMTSAGVEALSGFENLNNVSSAISQAKSFISSSELSSGGFGNPFSTAWVLQLIDSTKSEAYLSSLQGEDGGIIVDGDDLNSRIWATSYVIPAMMHKSWDSILNNFTKPVTQSTSNLSETEEVKKEAIVEPIKLEEIKKEIPNTSIEKLVKKQVKSNIIKNDKISVEKSIDDTHILKEGSIETPTKNNKRSGFLLFFKYVWSLIRSLFI